MFPIYFYGKFKQNLIEIRLTKFYKIYFINIL